MSSYKSKRFLAGLLMLEFTKGICLVLQDSNDGLDGVTTLELDGEWMFGQYNTSLLFISLQGRLEKPAKTSGS
jgi:hypothetical protein